MRPDQQDYQGTAVTVEVAQKLEVPHLMLLINKVLPSFDFESLQQKVEAAYNIPVAGVLPESEEMIGLGSSEIFCLKYPDHPITKTLQGIASRIMKE